MDLELLLEAERRGILPPEKASLLAEARKRGLVGGEPPQPAQPQADTSFMGRVKDNVMGVDDGIQSYGEKAAALLNKAGESMTFGAGGDEANAAIDSALGRGSYEDRLNFYRDQQSQIEESNPGAALAADIGGAMVAPLGAIGLVGKGAGIGKKMLASGAATGAQSAAYGFAEGEGGLDNRLDGASQSGLVGAGIGTAIPVAGAGVQKVANAIVGRKAMKAAAANAPTTEQLREQGTEAYRAVDDMGVSIKPQAFDRMARGVTQDMADQGLDVLPGPSSLTPKSARLAQIMGEMSSEMAADSTASLPFKSLDQLRRKAGVPAADMGNKVESSIGSQAIGTMDDFVRNLSPSDLDSGDAAAIGPAIEKARDVWSRMSRSQVIDDAIDGSENYLGGGSSGIRNQFARILRSDKLNRGFSDAEKKAMRRVVNGSLPEQALNLIGGGMGQLATMGAGGMVGGLPGAFIGGGVGLGARKGSEALSRKNAELVRAVIANGGMKELPEASQVPADLVEKLIRRTTAVAQQ